MDPRTPALLLPLLRRPRTVLNLLRWRVLRGVRGERVPFLPLVLDIEPTSYCNFRCTMCHVADPDFPHTHLSFELFTTIIDTNPQLIKIHLQGMGEPLLAPRVFDMATYARKRGILVQTTTNGSLLTPARVDALVRCRFTSIGVSLDGACAQTFEAIRRGGDFKQVTDGARRLSAALSAARSPTRLRAWTVVQQANAGELGAIVDLCHDIGFHELVFQPNLSDWGKVGEHTHDAVSDAAGLSQQLEQACARGRSINQRVRVFTGDRYTSASPCLWPWHSAFIDARGDVVPCCILGDSRICSLGSLTSTPLRAIWNAPPYREFRRAHRSGAIPPFCANCYCDTPPRT